MSPPQICIVGAGISGLVLGRCLLSRGICATILEKSKPSAHRNSYGITLHSHSYRPLLKILDLDESTFCRRVAVDAAVGGVGRVSGSAIAGEKDGASLRANRNRFEALLAEGLEVQWESEVVGVEPNGNGMVTMRLGGGGQRDDQVVVGADGPHSLVRKAVAPDAEFAVLPFAVYNGRRSLSNRDFESRFASKFDGGNVLEHQVGGSLLQLSVGDRNHDEVSMNYTYSRPGRDGGDALYRPERSKSAAKETPEALFEEIEGLQDSLPEPFKTVFDTSAMRKDRLLNWLMRTMEVEPAQLRAGAKQGILLLGDAVHAEPILGSKGANEAIQDAMLLAEQLAASGEELFYHQACPAWQKNVADSVVRIEQLHARPRAVM